MDERDRIIAELLDTSPEFVRYWDDMAVEPLRTTRKQLIHPRAGELDVQCDFVLGDQTFWSGQAGSTPCSTAPATSRSGSSTPASASVI